MYSLMLGTKDTYEDRILNKIKKNTLFSLGFTATSKYTDASIPVHWTAKELYDTYCSRARNTSKCTADKIVSVIKTGFRKLTLSVAYQRAVIYCLLKSTLQKHTLFVTLFFQPFLKT